jgi:hypothetical protein
MLIGGAESLASFSPLSIASSRFLNLIEKARRSGADLRIVAISLSSLKLSSWLESSFFSDIPVKGKIDWARSLYAIEFPASDFFKIKISQVEI